MNVLDGMLLVFAAFVSLPVAVLLAEVVCALAPRRAAAAIPDVPRPRLTVLVPAHNESRGILGALNSILPQLSKDDRLLVVADNCSDDTAQVAAAGGAEVVARSDASRPGKGYALDFGLEYLARDLLRKTPETVIIVDADCEVAPGCLDRIARLCTSTGRPVQAMYLMKAPESAGKMGAIGEFAWIIKNKVRPLGVHYLGLPCQLMGTGMALPWSGTRSVEAGSGHIVEDLRMGLDFARAGMPPLFCPEALVTSALAGSEEGSRTQRTRWEHGHLGLMIEVAPRLFLDAVKRMDGALLMLALDICVPPLALLALAVLALSGLCILNALAGASLVPLAASGAMVLMFAAAIGLSWWRYGREAVTSAELLHVFPYMIRKLPLYVAFLFHRQQKWVRSKRDAD